MSSFTKDPETMDPRDVFNDLCGHLELCAVDVGKLIAWGAQEGIIQADSALVMRDRIGMVLGSIRDTFRTLVVHKQDPTAAVRHRGPAIVPGRFGR